MCVPVPSMPFLFLSQCLFLSHRPWFPIVGPGRHLRFDSHQQFGWHSFLVSRWRFGQQHPLLVLASSSPTTTGIAAVLLTCRGVTSLFLASCKVHQRTPVYWGVTSNFFASESPLRSASPLVLAWQSSSWCSTSVQLSFLLLTGYLPLSYIAVL